MTKKQREKLLKKFENVNPFKVDDDLDTIYKAMNDNKNKTKITINEIEREYDLYLEPFVNSCERYKVKNAEINTIIIDILKYFIDSSNDEALSRTEILNFIRGSDEESSSKDRLNFLTKNSLGTLKCSHIITDVTAETDSSDKRKTFYQARPRKWFLDQRYVILNNNLLKALAPLLVEYVKSSDAATVPRFFDKVDSILEYVLQPYENHNENFYIEKYLIEHMEHVNEKHETTLAKKVIVRVLDKTKTKKDKYTIIVNDTEIHTKIITITPSRIIFDDEGKVLLCNDSNDKGLVISMNDIIRVLLEEEALPICVLDSTTKDLSFRTQHMQDGNYYYLCHPQYKYSFVNEDYFEEKYEDILLELPQTALDYFKIKPLANMTIYATDKEKETFKNLEENVDNADIIIGGSHFYVTATDTIENATSIIMHVLSSVKIIKPTELTKSVYENIKQFSNKHPW